MIIDNGKKIQEMSGGMDVDSPVKNAQTGAAAATVEETAAGPADADGAREAAPPVNVEEGWRRQGRQRPQIETVEAKVMMYGRFSVQIEGPRDGVTVQAIWSELVRDQSMELMADWKPTWYAPGVQKQCSKFMQLQETPLVKLLAEAGAMQGWLPLFNGRVKCVAAVRRPRDVPSAALRPTEPTPTPPAPAAGNTIPAAAGAARPGVATRKKEHGAAWRDALLQTPKQEVESDRLTKVEARVEQLECVVAQRQPPAPAAATPEVPKWNQQENEFRLLQQELHDHKEEMEEMKGVVAQWQSSALAAATPAPMWDPLAHEVQLLQREFREYKARMEKQVAEVQAVVGSQAQAAAAEIQQLKAQLAMQQMELDRVRVRQEAEVTQIHQIVAEPATPAKNLIEIQRENLKERENEIWAAITAEQSARLLDATKYDVSVFTPPPKPPTPLRLSFPSPLKQHRLVPVGCWDVQVASTSKKAQQEEQQQQRRARKHRRGQIDASPSIRVSAPGGGRGSRSPSPGRGYTGESESSSGDSDASIPFPSEWGASESE